MTLVLERHSRRCQPTLVTLATAYAPIVDRCRVNTYSPLQHENAAVEQARADHHK